MALRKFTKKMVITFHHKAGGLTEANLDLMIKHLIEKELDCKVKITKSHEWDLGFKPEPQGPVDTTKLFDNIEIIETDKTPIPFTSKAKRPEPNEPQPTDSADPWASPDDGTLI